MKNRGIAGICAIGCFLGLSLSLPYLAFAVHAWLPRGTSNLLFFAPQYLFSFRYVVKPVPYGFEPLFSPAGAMTFGVLLWILVGVAYGLLTRRLNLKWVVLAAPLVIIVVTLLVHFLFGAIGYDLQLDGP